MIAANGFDTKMILTKSLHKWILFVFYNHTAYHDYVIPSEEGHEVKL
jgi:hypothetical protein